ncbi:MAG: hypothetical protein AB1716_13755, partial [Planctomycetota bacterium]
MASKVRFWKGAVLCVLALTPLAAAQNKDLQAANELFARLEYKAALDALQKIDREALSEAERGQLDSLLKELPEAIQRNERA